MGQKGCSREVGGGAVVCWGKKGGWGNQVEETMISDI